MGRGTNLILAATLTLAVLTPSANAEFDPVAGEYPYNQPDPAGDVQPAAQVTFGDLTSLSITTLGDGSLLFRMKIVDLSMATGNLRYCVFFEVEGKKYQTGFRGQVVNGAPNGAVTSCSWTTSTYGASVGVPTWDAANDQVRSKVSPDAIEGLVIGSAITAIVARAGATEPVQGTGDPALFDTLTPSVDPKDFTHGVGATPLPGVGGADLTVDIGTSSAAAEPGGNASYAFKLRNNATSDANASLAAEGLPAGFEATFDPPVARASQSMAANVSVTVHVPMNATAGGVEFQVNATADNSTVLVPLSLTVLAPSGAPSPTDVPSENATASPETGGASPAPGLIAAAGAVALAIGMRRRKQP